MNGGKFLKFLHEMATLFINDLTEIILMCVRSNHEFNAFYSCVIGQTERDIFNLCNVHQTVFSIQNKVKHICFSIVRKTRAYAK